MIEILYDVRWIGNHGIGRFACEIYKALPDLVPFQARRRPWHALDPAFLGAALWRKRPRLFFTPGYNSPVGWPKPFVFTLHDLNHLCVRDNSSTAKRAYYRHIVRPACDRAVFVLTVSEYSKREIAAWAKVKDDKVINVGNGVGSPFVPTGPKYEPGYPYLLYVGSRKPHKNLPRLLEAYFMSGIRREVRLVISGRPDQQILREIEGRGLNGNVVFADSDTDADLSDIYRGALGFVFPSLYEGFGLPPLEALACGTPVLTSNVCSLPEVVGDSAILVDPLDIEAIADGIRRLVHDSALTTELRQKGLLRAKKFSWGETADRTREVLHMAAASN
jgi:glycosyltransferase involved in cell wall biosynthesis